MTNKKAIYEAVREGIRQLPATEAAKIETMSDPAIMLDTLTVVSHSRDVQFWAVKNNHVVVVFDCCNLVRIMREYGVSTYLLFSCPVAHLFRPLLRSVAKKYRFVR